MTHTNNNFEQKYDKEYKFEINTQISYEKRILIKKKNRIKENFKTFTLATIPIYHYYY